MSIHQELAEHKAKAQAMLADKFHVLTDDINRVRETGIVDHMSKVGQPAPDFTLPDAFGEKVSIKTLLTMGPAVVSFYRGEWCPFCNIDLRGLQKEIPRMKELGASLIAISPEKPDHGIVMTEKNKLTFPVLSDFGNKVARQFGIVFQVGPELSAFAKNVFRNDITLRNGEGSNELPIPSTFVIDQKGIIRFAHADVDYMTGRTEPEAIINVLKSILHS